MEKYVCQCACVFCWTVAILSPCCKALTLTLWKHWEWHKKKSIILLSQDTRHVIRVTFWIGNLGPLSVRACPSSWTCARNNISTSLLVTPRVRGHGWVENSQGTNPWDVALTQLAAPTSLHPRNCPTNTKRHGFCGAMCPHMRDFPGRYLTGLDQHTQVAAADCLWPLFHWSTFMKTLVRRKRCLGADSPFCGAIGQRTWNHSGAVWGRNIVCGSAYSKYDQQKQNTKLRFAVLPTSGR